MRDKEARCPSSIFQDILFYRHKLDKFCQYILCEEKILPTYILMSKLTPEGRRTILEKPDRIKEVNKEIEAFGAKVLQQYSLLGSYDFINILEAPSNDIINKVSIILGSRGTIEITSMPAMKIDDFIAILKTRKRNRIKH